MESFLSAEGLNWDWGRDSGRAKAPVLGGAVSPELGRADEPSLPGEASGRSSQKHTGENDGSSFEDLCADFT